MNVWGRALMPRIGFAYGAFQSYARAFYAELIPPGEEARWCVSLDPFFFVRVADGTIGMHCSPSRTRCACVCIVELTILTLTRQSSSFVGPLIVGLIADSTGNIRYAFFFLVIMVWLAVPVLLSVNVDQGRIDAQTYSVERVHEGTEVPGGDDS